MFCLTYITACPVTCAIHAPHLPSHMHRLTSLFISPCADVRHRLVEIDDFMAGLWKVHLAVKKEGFAQVLRIYSTPTEVLWLTIL